MATTEISEDTMTLAELQAEAEERGLPVSGTKAELVDRITAYDAEHEVDGSGAMTVQAGASREGEIPDLNPDDYTFNRLYEDGNFDLYQKRGYVIAAVIREEFSFGGSTYEAGVVIISQDENVPPEVIEIGQFEREYVAVPPGKYIEAHSPIPEDPPVEPQ